MFFYTVLCPAACRALETHGHNALRFSPRLCHRINSKAFQKRAQPNIPVAQNQMSCHILSSWHLGSFGPRGFQNIPLEWEKIKPCKHHGPKAKAATSEILKGPSKTGISFGLCAALLLPPLKRLKDKGYKRHILSISTTWVSIWRRVSAFNFYGVKENHFDCREDGKTLGGRTNLLLWHKKQLQNKSWRSKSGKSSKANKGNTNTNRS